MKVFGTHLPPLPRNELILVMGQVQRALAESGWSTPANPGILVAEGSGQAGSVRGEALLASSGDSELRITFSETATVTAAIEQTVGATMNTIHRKLVMLLGAPPVPRMWSLTSGRWMFGSRFDS